VRVQREEQALITRAVAQALHHGQQGRQAEAETAMLLGDRHAEHTELRAPPPAVEIERLGRVRRDHIAGEGLSRERDGRLLQPVLLVAELHGEEARSQRQLMS
jgi:hypothetical protein